MYMNNSFSIDVKANASYHHHELQSQGSYKGLKHIERILQSNIKPQLMPRHTGDDSRLKIFCFDQNNYFFPTQELCKFPSNVRFSQHSSQETTLLLHFSQGC